MDCGHSLFKLQQRALQGLFADGVVGVVYKERAVPETLTFGQAKTNTIFEIGSITKSFTGILFARLILDKRLSSDDPVEKFVPGLAGTFAGQIRLSELATHTSGLARIPDDLPETSDPYADYSWNELLQYLKTAKAPGGLKPYPADYSNTGFALLGKVLELAANESFDGLLSDDILAPLQMTDTFMVAPPNASSRFIDGHTTPQVTASHWSWLVFGPTGAVRSTVVDMVKYIKANLELNISPLGQAMKLSQEKGWGWDSQILKLPFPYKNGGTGGFASAMFIDRNRGAAAIVLTNISYEADSLIVPILKATRP